MASTRIKKKATSEKASAMPRQAALPCLIFIALILFALLLVMFFGLRHTG